MAHNAPIPWDEGRKPVDSAPPSARGAPDADVMSPGRVHRKAPRRQQQTVRRAVQAKARRRPGHMRAVRVSRGGGCRRRRGKRRCRAPAAARGSSCSRWSGSRAWWPSSADACGESRRIVRRRTNERYAKAWGCSFFPCRGSGRCGPWPSVVVARRGWGDRAIVQCLWTREPVVPGRSML